MNFTSCIGTNGASVALIPPQGAEGQEGAGRPDFKEYQGISFGNWLDLFIDYAISLAAEGQYDEAYRVCEAAKDSTVFTVSEDNTFFIYIAWGGKFPGLFCPSQPETSPLPSRPKQS